jgi:hypothetical protein
MSIPKLFLDIKEIETTITSVRKLKNTWDSRRL